MAIKTGSMQMTGALLFVAAGVAYAAERTEDSDSPSPDTELLKQEVNLRDVYRERRNRLSDSAKEVRELADWCSDRGLERLTVVCILNGGCRSYTRRD